MPGRLEHQLYTAQLRSMEDARDVVIRRVDHPWMGTLVDKFFEGARYEFDTSVTNEVLITLDGGTVIGEGCQFGAEPALMGQSWSAMLVRRAMSAQTRSTVGIFAASRLRSVM